MTIETAVHDLYARRTAKDGGYYVTQHRVWDSRRFIEAREDECKKAKGPTDLSKFEVITRAQYLKER